MSPNINEGNTLNERLNFTDLEIDNPILRSENAIILLHEFKN